MLVLLFYINVFYLPTLKRLREQNRSSNETVVLFIKMLCIYYHVYVPLLLRLSNDVEGNLGVVIPPYG